MTNKQLAEGKKVWDELCEMKKELKSFRTACDSDINKRKPISIAFWAEHQEVPDEVKGDVLNLIKDFYQKRIEELEKEFEAI